MCWNQCNKTSFQPKVVLRTLAQNFVGLRNLLFRRRCCFKHYSRVDESQCITIIQGHTVEVGLAMWNHDAKIDDVAWTGLLT